MLLARSAGATGILVRTGNDSGSENADYTVGNLKEAVELIIKKDINEGN
jgi:phosphoglycolate phosphatase-like HAD superfamily hydrolase